MAQQVGDGTRGKLERGIEEHFGDAGVLIPANIISNVLERAPEHGPVASLGRGRHLERSARGDDEAHRIAPGALRMLANAGNGVSQLLRRHVATGVAIAEPARPPERGLAVPADQERRAWLLDRLGLDPRGRHEIEGPLEFHLVLRPQRVEAFDELVDPRAPLFPASTLTLSGVAPVPPTGRPKPSLIPPPIDA